MHVVLTGVQRADEFTLESPTGEERSPAWLEGIFRAHYPRLVTILARLVGDRGQAEEIAADVFCKLSHRPGLLSKAEDRVAWMYRVAMNAGLAAVRGNRRGG